MAGKSQCSGDSKIRGQRLTRLMREKKLTLQDIANAIDNSNNGKTDTNSEKIIKDKDVNTISRYKSGQYPLPDKVVNILCEKYKLEKNYFDPSEDDLISCFADQCLQEHNRKTNTYDFGNLERHSTEDLWKITRTFEEKLKTVAYTTGNKSRIIYYCLNVESPFSRITWKSTVESMLTCWGKLKIRPPIILGMKDTLDDTQDNQRLNDPEYLKYRLLGVENISKKLSPAQYWSQEFEHLQKQFKKDIEPLLRVGDQIEHLSVFALAPQPLIVELGHLLKPFPAVDIYQPHNEPLGWAWQTSDQKTEYLIQQPESIHEIVVLNLSLSASVQNSAIKKVLGDEVSIWTLTIDEPQNDFLKNIGQLQDFRRSLRDLLKLIFKKILKKNVLHVFLSTPIAIAFEIGRLWNPDSDPELKLYGLSRESAEYSLIHTISKS